MTWTHGYHSVLSRLDVGQPHLTEHYDVGKGFWGPQKQHGANKGRLGPACENNSGNRHLVWPCAPGEVIWGIYGFPKYMFDQPEGNIMRRKKC